MVIGRIPIKLALMFIGVALLATACGGAATDSRLTIEDWEAAMVRYGIDIKHEIPVEGVLPLGALRATGYGTEDERFVIAEYKDAKAAAEWGLLLDTDDTFFKYLPMAVNGNLRLYYIQGKIEGFDELEALLGALEQR